MIRFLIVLLLAFPALGRAQGLSVFAAASLTDAMRDVSVAWQAAGHEALRQSFASSSTLARQIEQGAPANIFASADERWMDYLAERKLIAADTRKDLLGNDIVLVVPATHKQTVEITRNLDIGALLGATGRLATGDPVHVPVGAYAEQSLRKLGLWDIVLPRLARTDDVRTALVLVERGEAPLGIVYSTDAAASSGVAVAGVFPSDTHDPIAYPFAVTASGDTAEARALLTFLEGPQARDIFAKRGFKVE